MMPRAGVIGWPVGHSLSPRIHRFWLAELGIRARYEAVVVSPDWLEDTIDRFRVGGWRGFNVTVPHKEAIIPLLDRLDPVAEIIGAVNTVVAIGDGQFEGRNSDAPGFMASLRAAQSVQADRPAVVLGAGGAARAILAALNDAGLREIRIVNRDRARAQTLASSFPVRLGRSPPRVGGGWSFDQRDLFGHERTTSAGDRSLIPPGIGHRDRYRLSSFDDGSAVAGSATGKPDRRRAGDAAPSGSRGLHRLVRRDAAGQFGIA
jgi:hypothetical protein